MTQSKDDNEYTIDLSNMTTVTIDSTVENTDYPFCVSDINTDWLTIDTTQTITVDTDFEFDSIIITPTLWSETLPDIDTVTNMCEEYPALAKAYENFKTVYKLVEQDYKGKHKDD